MCVLVEERVIAVVVGSPVARPSFAVSQELGTWNGRACPHHDDWVPEAPSISLADVLRLVDRFDGLVRYLVCYDY
jgi:hypothetical protein